MAPPGGFDTSRVSPTDAVVTLRSLPRRFTEVFNRAEGAGPAGRDEVLTRRPVGGGRTGQARAGPASALDIARHGVRVAIEHLRAAERAIGADDT